MSDDKPKLPTDYNPHDLVDGSYYFTDMGNDFKKVLVEKRRVFDVRDAEKWAHPLLVEGWEWVGNNQCSDPSLSWQERYDNGIANFAILEEILKNFPEQDHCTVEEVMAPGCPEEPDTPAKVLIYRPKTGLKKKNNPCLIFCLGGGLTCYSTKLFPIHEMCANLGAIGIIVKYRFSWEAPYPAALNDEHAGYQYAYDHPDELGIDRDKFIITGHSAGGWLALNLGFRAKRYGYNTRGIVATCPVANDREWEGTGSMLYTDTTSCESIHSMALQYGCCAPFSMRIGGEIFANHATVGDCVGYPPTFLHAAELDPLRDGCLHFHDKLPQAKTFTELHDWGGTTHASGQFASVTFTSELNEYSDRLRPIFYNELKDLIKYDFRRPWVEEELKENGPWW